MKQIVKFKVNGMEEEKAVHTHHTLLEVLRAEFAPISDMRASATYRLETAQALLTKALLELQGETQTRVLVA